jgi:hypothetical protein
MNRILVGDSASRAGILERRLKGTGLAIASSATAFSVQADQVSRP